MIKSKVQKEYRCLRRNTHTHLNGITWGQDIHIHLNRITWGQDMHIHLNRTVLPGARTCTYT